MATAVVRDHQPRVFHHLGQGFVLLYKYLIWNLTTHRQEHYVNSNSRYFAMPIVFQVFSNISLVAQAYFAVRKKGHCNSHCSPNLAALSRCCILRASCHGITFAISILRRARILKYNIAYCKSLHGFQDTSTLNLPGLALLSKAGKLARSNGDFNSSPRKWRPLFVAKEFEG